MPYVKQVFHSGTHFVYPQFSLVSETSQSRPHEQRTSKLFDSDESNSSSGDESNFSEAEEPEEECVDPVEAFLKRGLGSSPQRNSPINAVQASENASRELLDEEEGLEGASDAGDGDASDADDSQSECESGAEDPSARKGGEHALREVAESETECTEGDKSRHTIKLPAMPHIEDSDDGDESMRRKTRSSNAGTLKQLPSRATSSSKRTSASDKSGSDDSDSSDDFLPARLTPIATSFSYAYFTLFHISQPNIPWISTL